MTTSWPARHFDLSQLPAAVGRVRRLEALGDNALHFDATGGAQDRIACCYEVIEIT